MAKKKMTIEDLAIMVQKGFSEMATKEDLKNEINSLRSEMNERFDNIEKVVPNHERRIKVLESETKEIKEALAL